MADLPVERILPDLPPFTNVGVDYLIWSRLHMYDYQGNTSRGNLLDTDSCINAICRFVCHRGQVSHLRSDNGTNFIGAEKGLREALESQQETECFTAEGNRVAL